MNRQPPSPSMAALLQMLSINGADHPGAMSADDDVRLLCWMLESTRPWSEAARDALGNLFDAHRDGVRDAATWRRLRRAAMVLGDHPDADVRALGKVAEAAAWPLESSQAGLTEVMTAIGYLRAERAIRLTGWTSEDEATAQSALKGIAAGDGTTIPRREQIPVLFRAAHPDLERRFSRQLDASNHAFHTIKAEVASWIAGASR